MGEIFLCFLKVVRNLIKIFVISLNVFLLLLWFFFLMTACRWEVIALDLNGEIAIFKQREHWWQKFSVKSCPLECWRSHYVLNRGRNKLLKRIDCVFPLLKRCFWNRLFQRESLEMSIDGPNVCSQETSKEFFNGFKQELLRKYHFCKIVQDTIVQISFLLHLRLF